MVIDHPSSIRLPRCCNDMIIPHNATARRVVAVELDGEVWVRHKHGAHVRSLGAIGKQVFDQAESGFFTIKILIVEGALNWGSDGDGRGTG